MRCSAANRWCRDLSGLEVEYRIVQIYCRDAGRKEAELGFSLWKDGAKQPESKSATIPFVFESAPAVLVKLQRPRSRRQVEARRQAGRSAAFTFTDSRGRIYPSPSRRLAPDFNFHFQIYRADGETIALQPGTYTVAYTRGPEYLVLKKTITVPNSRDAHGDASS